MTHADTGTPGATAASWLKGARLIIYNLCKEHGLPKNEEDTNFIIDEFLAIVLDEEDNLLPKGKENVRDAFMAQGQNIIRSLTSRRRKPNEEEKAAAAEEVRRWESKIRKGALLDMVLSNGKKLRDCTGMEVRLDGGGLTRVGYAVGPNEIVGEKLSEAQVREIYVGKA